VCAGRLRDEIFGGAKNMNLGRLRSIAAPGLEAEIFPPPGSRARSPRVLRANRRRCTSPASPREPDRAGGPLRPPHIERRAASRALRPRRAARRPSRHLLRTRSARPRVTSRHCGGFPGRRRERTESRAGRRKRAARELAAALMRLQKGRRAGATQPWTFPTALSAELPQECYRTRKKITTLLSGRAWSAGPFLAFSRSGVPRWSPGRRQSIEGE
jgi:hypothetical protein